MKMNSREKVLIIILAAIVILLGGFKLLIEPAQNKLAAKKAEYETALDNKAKADLNVLRAKGIDKENADIEKKIVDTSAPFFPDIKNDKLQLFFNDIIVKDNINYSSFVMTPPAATQIINLPSLTDKLTYPAKDAALTIISINEGKPIASPTPIPTKAPTNGANPNTEKVADLIEMCTVTMQYTGTIAQTNLLIDDIKKSGRIARISSINISVDDKNVTTVTISAECFGVKKYTTTDVLLKDTLVK
jgi:hypothetical protein